MNPLDRNSKAPLFQQIIKQIIEDIQNGRLQPGDKLPPERQLAKAYQVNRSTVNHALEELASLGWITRRQGSGTEISQGPWGSRQTPHYQWQALLQRAPFTPDPYLTELNAAKARPDVLDLYTGELPASLIPDFAFPAMRWEKILAAEQQVTATGYEPLKEAILHSLTQTFSLASHNQDLLITSGSSQGISLILQTLLAPTEAVATEEPSFLFALPLFQSLGIPLVGIPCDEEGILPDALERSILSKKIRFLYLNPTFQNPTGRLMSLTRRKAVVELCRKYSLPIIEDDVFGELDFDTPLPKLKALAPELVIYLGSLSKLFGTSIKIGWLFGPVPLIASLAHAKQRLEAETTIFPQLLATSALQSPEYPLNHYSLMTTLETRAQAFQRNVALFAEDWQIRSIKGGLYTWLTWRHEPLQRKDWQLFLEAGLLVAPAFLFSKETNSFRLNYTRLETADLPDFQRRFTVISEQLKLRSAKKMTDTLNLLQNHRTYRQFDESYELSPEELQNILDSARQAPSWMNGQLYSIIVVQDPSIREKLVALSPRNPHIRKSSVFLVFLADLKRTQKVAVQHQADYHVGDSVDPLLVATADCALALENAVVATSALGLGSVVVGGIRNEIDAVAELLHLPDYVFPVAGLSIGKPAVDMEVKPRLPEKAVVHFDTYQDYDYSLIEDYDITMRKFGEKRETKDWTQKFLDVYSAEPTGKIDAFLKKQGLLK